ncbi:MAG TPA: HD domain-containing protein [Anaerolineaceae bacterium]|nr:HD domain-containing protein [Anaerolineaceae bacterium]
MLTLEKAQEWYINTDAVHDFSHIERVYRMARRLAQAEGADLEIVSAAALLHDADGTTPGSDVRREHHLRSADFAALILKDEGWPEERIQAVQHCIRAHRYRDDREPPETIEARVLFDADKLDVLGAIGAVRTVVYAALAGTPFYTEPSQQFLETGVEVPGELHSAYHEYLFKLRNVEKRLFTQTARLIARQRGKYLEEFFNQLIAEYKGER